MRRRGDGRREKRDSLEDDLDLDDLDLDDDDDEDETRGRDHDHDLAGWLAGIRTA